MARWGYSDVMELIGLYEEEPVLWDPNHPEYRLEIKSNAAWERIRDAMGPDYKVGDLKRKMVSLKQMYHKNKRENTIPNNRYDNNFYYFRELDSFLGKTSTCVTTADSTQVEKIGDIEGVKVALDQKLRDITKDLATKDDVKELTQQVVNLQLENNTLREEVEKIGDTENVKVKDAGVPQHEDVCGLYGKLLAEKLWQLPARKRLNLMHEVDGIVFRHLDVE